MVLSGLVRLSGGAGLCSITLTCLSSSSPLSCELSPRDSLFGTVMILSQVERGQPPSLEECRAQWVHKKHGGSSCQRGGGPGSLGGTAVLCLPPFAGSRTPFVLSSAGLIPTPLKTAILTGLLCGQSPTWGPTHSFACALKVAARRKSQTCTRSKQLRTQSGLAGLPEGYKGTL